jgi:sugar lactone lactonase YvrE
MSRLTAAVRFANILPGVILVAAFSLMSSPALYAGTITAAPQLLPYTVTAVAGGGTYGTTSNYTTAKGVVFTPNPFTVGQSCGAGTALKALNVVGDGCPATDVLLYGPNDAVADSEGNVFIVDFDNRSIRRVDAHTGIITTVAGSTYETANTNPGTGVKCSDGVHTSTDAWGDGCPATEVFLDNPEAIALDAQGNIWFSDYSLGAVREINKSTGIISTVVNTAFVYGNYEATSVAYTTGYATGSFITAANGELNEPYALTFDTKGNLYIADQYNDVVDVVNPTAANTTVAGVYTLQPGEIFTIAGTGCNYVAKACYGAYGTTNGASPYPSTGAALDSPYQVAVDKNTGNIYIADEYPYDVRVINGTTGVISTFAGTIGKYMSGALARGPASTTYLDSIYGVATDAQGNVYIAISYVTGKTPIVNYIARVDRATGEIYPIAGQLATAVPTAGAAQTGATYCAAKTDAIGDGCPGTQATLWHPYFPFVDPAGNVYVTDSGDNLIRKISVGTQFPATTAGTGASVTQYIDVHFGAGDTPMGSSPNYTGAFTLPNPNTFAGFTLGTTACTLNTDTTTDCVLSVTFNPPAGTAGLLTAPLTVKSAGGLVSSFSLTGTSLGPMLAVDPGTQATIASALTGVNSVAIDLGNNVYATVPGNDTVVTINPSGTVSTLYTGTATTNAVTVDAAGNVYVGLVNGAIMKLPGGVAANAVQFASGFTTPSGLAVDAYGNLYVSDSAANTVTEILAGTGVQVILATNASAGLSVPTGLAVDSYGNVFVANTNGNSVIELPFAPNSAPVTLGTGLSTPQGVAVDPAGSLYVADKGNKRIVYIPNESGTLNSNDQIAIITGLGSPTGVAILSYGTIYVSDSTNNAIYQYTRNAATIDLGNALSAIGLQSAQTNTASADIISMGNQPAVFGSNFWTEGGANGTNTGSFNLTPSSIPVSTLFPAAGYGVSLTPSFTPAALGPLSATFTFDSTSPASQPTLTLSGSGIQPHDLTTTVISTTVPTGQSNWIYGQNVVVNITVSVNSGLPAPTGNVLVYIDGSSTPVNTGLTAGTNTSTASLSISSLSAGGHAIYAYYGGDTESSNSTSSTLNFTMDKAPLTVTVNPVSANLDAPIPNPVTTGTLGGVQNGDLIGVSYSTTATAGSPAGQYLISAQVTGGALANYTVTIGPNGPGGVAGGTLTISKDSTVTALGVSAISVNNTQQVILTATVSSVYNYAVVTAPTGTVTFFNTVGGVQTQIGAPQTINSSGVATLTTTFAVVGASTSNTVTAVYSGNSNFVTSTSAPVVIVSGVPTFSVVSGAGTNSQLTIQPGQSGLMSFTLLPMYGYNGTITFTCTTPSTTVTCSFSPNPYSPNGSSTPVLVTVTFNTTAPVNTLSLNHRPSGILGAGGTPYSLAAIPGLALLFGFSRLRRRFLRGYRYLLLFALCLIGLGFSGCGGGKITPGTPAGVESITIVATGTGGSFATVTQQFTVSLTVQ